MPAGIQHAGGGAGLAHHSPVQLGRGPSAQAAPGWPVRAHGYQPAADGPAVDCGGHRSIPVAPRLTE
eukprot:4750632-Alexandrium_andersonii.AAC.1